MSYQTTVLVVNSTKCLWRQWLTISTYVEELILTLYVFYNILDKINTLLHEKLSYKVDISINETMIMKP